MSPTKEFRITEGDAAGRTAVLRVQGRLDGVTAPALLAQCAKVQANGQNLVLNLAEVTFMGSSGVGALLVLVEQFREQGGAIRCAELSPAARSVVELLDLAQYLAIDATEQDALVALGA
jgi:anti-sigma B factor antagonist